MPHHAEYRHFGPPLHHDPAPGLTATTAMDAMTHAVEALTSTMSNRICDGQALHAIRLIGENLPAVVADGKNEKARLNMQIAATMAGWAFTIAQVGSGPCHGAYGGDPAPCSPRSGLRHHAAQGDAL